MIHINLELFTVLKSQIILNHLGKDDICQPWARQAAGFPPKKFLSVTGKSSYRCPQGVTLQDVKDPDWRQLMTGKVALATCLGHLSASLGS